jgi:putative oxygen-independent coproporphyrinogen III oxidase
MSENMSQIKENISIYIHWPFCIKKCPYCDFNSFVTKDIDHQKWTTAYLQSIKKYYSEILKNRLISTIFFGGGTPSLATPNMIFAIINALADKSEIASNVEITLEANPTSVEAQKLSEFKSAGINRVSMGIQSLRDTNLQFLGRNHSVKESLHAIDVVSKIFHNYSLDFIYALPHQTLSEWEAELQEAISLANGHMSIYQLTIENGTKFGVMARQGLLNEIDQEVAADMFEMTYNITKSQGLDRYEVSNHAKPGYESLHNLNYWRYGDYIGIGPGAHGRITKNSLKVMTIDKKQPEIWLNEVMSKNNALEVNQTLQDEDVRIESVMMGLRTIEGVNRNLIKCKDEIIQQLIADGMILQESEIIRTTKNGLAVLNTITQMLCS